MLNTIIVKPVFDRKHVATKVASRKPKKGLVQLSVLVNGERRFLSTGVKVHADQFAGERVVCHEQAAELNELMGAQMAAVIEVVNKCNREGKVFSWDMLQKLRVVNYKAGHGWIDWMEEKIRTRRLAEGTRKHQVTVLEFLREQKVTDWEQLTVETIRHLDDVLHERTVNGKPMMQTSIYGYHKVIRAYINLALCEGLMDRTPYSRFKVDKGESEPREVLSMEEIHRVEQLESRSLFVQHVRDLFLLQVWTGLCYADLMAADWEHIQDDTLSGHRVKTGVHYTTVILPQTRKILERYSYHIPKMAYDDYRRILVEMMGVLGINKKISTHNGRHTFATTVALGNGVPIEILKKMMGHKSVKTTERYARVQQPMVEREAERLAQLVGG